MSGAPRLVLRGARLLDGRSPSRKDATVVVEGERIARIANDAGFEARPDDRVVEIAGRTLMPGMFSCHFHSSWQGLSPISAPATGLHAPPALMALTAGKNARLALECGVTGVIGSSVGYGIDVDANDVDGVEFTPVFLVSQTQSDTDTVVGLPPDLDGTLTVRVIDADRTPTPGPLPRSVSKKVWSDMSSSRSAGSTASSAVS